MSKPMESAAAVRWREIVRKQAASGMSVAAYCRRAGAPSSSFYAWRRKLRDAGVLLDPVRSGAMFAEVRLTPAPDPAAAADSADDHGALELRLPRGRRVIVRPGFDRRTLLELVATLENGQAGDVGVADQEAGV